MIEAVDSLAQHIGLDEGKESPRPRRWGGAFMLALLAIIAAVAIAWCPLPWSAVLLLVAIAMIVLAMRANRGAAAVLLVNGAALVLALAAFEGYLGIQQRLGDGTRMEGTVEEGTQRNDLLGYAPVKDSKLIARKFYGNELIYDVVYSIGPDGLRIAPPSDAAPSECIVFFGDSISFGEGVRDEQTFAYRLGQKSGGRYAIYNFAYSGYGPHQMLANLQAGRVDQIVRCRPTHFFYLAILEHIPRVAGLAAWDRHGPRFRLTADGVIQDGHFDDPPRLADGWQAPPLVSAALGKFLTWQRFFGRSRDVNAKDLALFLAVIRSAAAFTHAHYAGSKFHLILWDGRDDPRLAVINDNLSRAGILVHPLTSIVPDFAANWHSYVLSPHDLHPNARFHDRVADYLLKELSAPTSR